MWWDCSVYRFNAGGSQRCQIDFTGPIKAIDFLKKYNLATSMWTEQSCDVWTRTRCKLTWWHSRTDIHKCILYFPPGCVLDPQGSRSRSERLPLKDVRWGLNNCSGLFWFVFLSTGSTSNVNICYSENKQTNKQKNPTEIFRTALNSLSFHLPTQRKDWIGVYSKRAWQRKSWSADTFS